MSLRLQRYEKKRTQQTFFLIIDNETPLGSHLTMVYFAAVNNIEEINNEINTRKRAGDMKKPQKAGVLTNTAKRNAL